MIIFIMLYYVVWFGSLLLAHNNLPYLALLLSLSISSIQLLILKKSSTQFTVIKQLVIFTSIGFTIDSLLSVGKLLTFYANPWEPFGSPWILGLWLNFSVLCIGIKHFLRMLKKYLFGMAFLGFPFAYYSGVSFGVAKFNYDMYSIISQGIVWAILFPIMCKYLLFNDME